MSKLDPTDIDADITSRSHKILRRSVSTEERVLNQFFTPWGPHNNATVKLCFILNVPVSFFSVSIKWHCDTSCMMEEHNIMPVLRGTIDSGAGRLRPQAAGLSCWHVRAQCHTRRGAPPPPRQRQRQRSQMTEAPS